MKTLRDAERARDLARIDFMNCTYHAEEVRERFGALSSEYRIAWKVQEDSKRRLVAALDAPVGLFARALA